ncbi:MAG: hypothetical protein BJ554DRAFT_4416, partial [Olpidium bornovanus]
LRAWASRSLLRLRPRSRYGRDRVPAEIAFRPRSRSSQDKASQVYLTSSRSASPREPEAGSASLPSRRTDPPARQDRFAPTTPAGGAAFPRREGRRREGERAPPPPPFPPKRGGLEEEEEGDPVDLGYDEFDDVVDECADEVKDGDDNMRAIAS